MTTLTPSPLFDTLIWEQTGAIATIRLNRPEAMNAMTVQMRRELCAALDRVDQDDRVRAVIVTGEGKAFCAGADLSSGARAFGQPQDARPEEQGRDGGGILARRLFACMKPVIGAIQGAAVGVGASMLLPMDIRLATPHTRVGFVFARRGIITDGCASWFLPRAVGISRALEWAMSGRLVDAQEALQAGLFREICELDRLLLRAHEFANELISQSAPVSVALIRQLMWRMQGAEGPHVAHAIESPLIEQRRQSADAKEGVESFMQKRPAQFPDSVSGDMPSCYPWWDGAKEF
jgi:enoyl-CoA hydratase/carnithine racemase